MSFKKQKIVIIDYGAGNTKSVLFALERVGVKAVLSNDANVINNADKIIFPGVGQAASAIKRLKEAELDKLIPTLTQPVLGICLGMQLLCHHTEEGNTRGLGVFSSSVKRFSNEVKVPQMGWNTISELQSNLFTNVAENSFMYLVHSYYVPLCNETVAVSNYNGRYSVAIQKDNFFGVQFHPEKSSTEGEKIIQNFLKL